MVKKKEKNQSLCSTKNSQGLLSSPLDENSYPNGSYSPLPMCNVAGSDRVLLSTLEDGKFH